MENKKLQLRDGTPQRGASRVLGFLQPTTNRRLSTGSRGFTLLLAALVSSIVLSLGAAIYQIAVKEVALSRLGRDSQLAFYAADTGAECALYWDVRYAYFATSAPATVVAPDPRCNGQTLTTSGRAATYPYTMRFTFEPNGFCTDVTVTKSIDGATNALTTTVHADGLSTTCATRAINTNALQRSVELHY